MQPISSTLATDTRKREIRWLSVSLRTLHCVKLVLWFLLFLILVFQLYLLSDSYSTLMPVSISF